MDKPFLSQEEINALLGGDNQVLDSVAENKESASLSPEEQDVLCEIGNISVGSSSTALSELLAQKVLINTPSLRFTTREEFQAGFDAPYLLVSVEYTSGIIGSNVIILKVQDAAIIANLMMGGDGKNCSQKMDEITLSAVSEAMNQMIGFSATSMSEMFQRTVEISPPKVSLKNFDTDEIQLNVNEDIFSENLVVISFQLQIGELVKSEIMLIMNPDVAKQQVQILMSTSTVQDTTIYQDSTIYNEEKVCHEDPTPLMQSSQTIRAEDNISINNNNLNLILDIPLKLTVLLGRTKGKIADVLKLTQGSIVELDRLENEPVDILVSDILIAKGEVVVTKEYFGVRITDIVSPEHRIQSLSPK